MVLQISSEGRIFLRYPDILVLSCSVTSGRQHTSLSKTLSLVHRPIFSKSNLSFLARSCLRSIGWWARSQTPGINALTGHGSCVRNPGLSHWGLSSQCSGWWSCRCPSVPYMLFSRPSCQCHTCVWQSILPIGTLRSLKSPTQFKCLLGFHYELMKPFFKKIHLILVLAEPFKTNFRLLRSTDLGHLGQNSAASPNKRN